MSDPRSGGAIPGPPPGSHRAQGGGEAGADVRAWPLATWRAIEAVPVFLIALMGGVLLAIPVIAVFESKASLYVAGAFTGELATLATVILWVRWVHGGPVSALGSSGRPMKDAAVGIALGLLLVLGAQFALELVRWIALQLLGRPLAQPEQVPAAVRGTALALLGPVVMVAAPLAEEAFFRGFLYQGLRRRYRVWPSALVSALLFGMAHFTGVASLQLLLPLALVGLGLALVYERRRSLLSAICAHATFNVFGFLSLVLTRSA